MTNPRILRPIAILASLALVGFITYAVVAATRPQRGAFPAITPPSGLDPGARAPTFLLDRLGGGAPVQLSRRPGEVVVVNFFASWCANCVAELGAFASVAKHAGSARFLGVDSDDTSSTEARALLEKAGDGYPVGIDPSGTTADRYLVAALPVTFFISRSGVIRGEIFGAATATELRSWLARLASSQT